LRSLSGADVINTIAGDGTPSYGGDGGLATLAQLDFPFGIAVDASGNIYIGDTGNHRIRVVTNPVSSGTISTVAGDGTPSYGGDGGLATLAYLSNPSGIAVDASGNIYIADTGNHCIRMVTNPGSSGTISTVAGDGTPSYGGDGGLATLAYLSNPSSVAVDASGNIYIADTGNHCIRVVTNPVSSGTISTVAGDGTPSYGGDGGLATLAYLSNPSGIAVDASGKIYIADTGNHCIRVVTKSTGTISTVAGDGNSGYFGDGGLATLAQLAYPFGVAVDASGNIYIADSANSRIRIVTNPGSFGTISIVAGDGNYDYFGDGVLATSARLNIPLGLCSDVLGNIYIADGENNRVRKVGDLTFPTESPTPSPTATPSLSPTATPTPSPTASPSPSPTATPSLSPTATPTPSPTASPSPSPTATPSLWNGQGYHLLAVPLRCISSCRLTYKIRKKISWTLL
jgi:trimeric autotransporter adhesin